MSTLDTFDSTQLVALVHAKMPFGKYAGHRLIDLPEPYLLWFHQKGFPPGQLGELMQLALLIKSEGLESLLTPLLNSVAPSSGQLQ